MAKRRTRRASDQPALVRHDGSLCATFVNTACNQRTSVRSYADLLVWGQQNAGLGAAEAQRLERTAGERPAAAEAVAARARETRDLLERVLHALVAHQRPAARDLEALNAALGEILANRRLVPAQSGYRWDFGDAGGDDLDRVLWPVLLDAAGILTGKYHRKVSECAGEDCQLLIVDRTPGSPRRWCSVCGNRARSYRHYHTKKKPAREARKRAAAASNARYRAELKRKELASAEEEAPAQDTAAPRSPNKRVF